MQNSASPQGNLQGKRCLVTGATSGIGLETAQGLAAQGANLVIVSRNPDRCQRLAEQLKSTSHGEITHHSANLADSDSIQKLVSDLLSSYDRLDVLVNNAGAMFLKREKSPDGFEMTWALNHLGYFRLTCGVMPLLKAAPSARIVSVASDAHRGMPRGLKWDDLQYETSKYRGFQAYCQSKLANILFARELSSRLQGTNITANCLHPGFVASNFFNWPGAPGAVTRMAAGVFAISPKKGALTSIHLASSSEISGQNGAYFSRSKAVAPSKAALDGIAAKRLWATTAAMACMDI